MENSRNGFPYQPLPQNGAEIRILRLLPGQFEDEIQCILQHIALDEDPQYAALSYVWGSPTVTLPITLRYEDQEDRQVSTKRQFGVTMNLEAALRHLRNPGYEQRLWIDAICINQEDMQERSLQVQKMTKIYSAASKVFVWLGRLVEKEEADMGILPDHMRALWISLRQAASQSSTSLSMSDHERSNNNEAVPIPSDALRSAYGSICGRSWFTRVWVLQEYILASSAVVVMAGPESMLFDDFLPAAFHAFAAAESQPSISSLFMPVVKHLYYRQNFNGRKFLSRPLGERILRALIDTTGFLNATDLRDQLYGLLGMLGDVSSHPALVPDYSKPLETFHLDLAHFIIESTQTLAVLQCIGRANQPSWVPDWDMPSPASFERLDGIQEYTKASFSSCKRVLYTRAIPLGRVVLSRLIPGNISTDPRTWCEIMKQLERDLFATPSVHNQFSNIRESTAALLEAILPASMEQQSPEKRDNKARYDILMGRSVWPGELVHPRRNTADDINHFVGVFQGLFGQGLGIIALSNGMIGRLLGEPGNNVSYEGDSAFIFPGCRTPLLLTPIGDTYTIHNRCDIGGHIDKNEEEHIKLLQQGQWEDITII